MIGGIGPGPHFDDDDDEEDADETDSQERPRRDLSPYDGLAAFDPNRRPPRERKRDR